MFGAVAITGMPPLSGFFGKVLILNAALHHEWVAWVFAVLLGAGLLTIIAMARTGSTIFYRTLPENPSPVAGRAGESLNRSAFMAVIGLFLVSPVLVICAQPVTAFTVSTANQLLDGTAYIEAVLSAPAVDRSIGE